MPKIPIYSEPDLLERLSDGVLGTGRKVVFLVGAPISAPSSAAGHGVLGVEGIIDLIRTEFNTKVGTLTELNKKVKNTPNRYQEAFTFLLGRRNQDVANDLIRKAVLFAHRDGESLIPKIRTLTDEDYSKLEVNPSDWYLSPAVSAIGRIVANYPETFGNLVLTSNFDPLIEISISAAGGNQYRTILSRDGSITDTTAEGCRVVHFHGYWYGADTLHTPRQLKQPRPKLHTSLSRLLSSVTIVVLAYSGWDDIFTDALVSVVEDDTVSPDIVWTFLESDDARIQKRHGTVLRDLRSGLDRGRVSLFRGIDCHLFLPKLLTALEQAPKVPQCRPSLSIKKTRLTREQLEMVLAQTTDSPPRVDAWVGRKKELSTLINARSPIVVITGIGGQGKSALASTYVQRINGTPEQFELWDWRDCREEGDRFNTQLLSIIERLSAGELPASELEGQDVNSLTDVFFQVLETRKCLFVFDNVDHYIDLETLQPVSGPRILFNKALSRQHSSRFVFTCRPNIRAHDPGILLIPLKEGLSLEETQELFELRRVPIAANENCIAELHNLTAGHPLWLNLVATQVASDRTTLPRILEEIKRGRGDLPENILERIWDTLKEKQRVILRTMAEAVRPETEERLSEYVQSRVHWKQFVKNSRALIELNLIVVKPRQDEPDLLDLHPVVRDYIKKKFPKPDQERYIAAILVVIDRFIGRFKDSLPSNASFEVLEQWTQKVELNINRKNVKTAAETLQEIMPHLKGRGYPEEFVRVARKLFEAISWEHDFQQTGLLDSVFEGFISCLVEIGERTEVDRLLKRYERSLPGKSSQYVNLCNLRCYDHWYAKEFQTAIEWGERGVSLKDSTKADITFSSDHNLALSRRDSGNPADALKKFLGTEKLEDVLNPDNLIEKKHASFYGNIGRCLHFMERLDDALVCYRKSASLLEREAPEGYRTLNQGYARRWIGEVFQVKRQRVETFVFYKAAMLKWKKTSPPRAADVQQLILALDQDMKGDLDSSLRLGEEAVENACKKWISGRDMRL